MKDSTFKTYNNVYNQMFKTKQQYLALALAFDAEYLHGFHDFAMNESRERWDYSEMIREHVALFRRKIHITDLPAPVQDFPEMSPKQVLEIGLKYDNAVLSAINTAIEAVETGEITFMTKLRDIMQYQVNEVHDCIAKLGFQGGDLYTVDEALITKFGGYD